MLAIRAVPTFASAMVAATLATWVDPGARAEDGAKSLHFATVSNLEPSVIAALIADGANSGALDTGGKFPFDTDVVSELMRPAPVPALASWSADHAASSLFLTATGEAELRFGLAVMPSGRRRDGLAASLERMLRTGFANRVLPFDSAAARAHAETAAAHRAAGRPISQSDGQIAAIA